VAHEPGHVLDAGAGLGQGPGGEHVAQGVERPRPPAVGPAGPAGVDGGGLEGVAPVVGAPGPPPLGGPMPLAGDSQSRCSVTAPCCKRRASAGQP
jgi:hypothetical protein